ncbi:MAG: DUF58 domain-containing protein [Lachnospiraceae bacterium]|nr:DUF58 domain-containing protein [Lachnospiraceae bacterium]
MRARRAVLGILWLLSLAAISFYGGTVSYGIFFALTFLPFFSLLYIVCVWLRYKVYQEIGSRNIVSGQSVPYYFVLQNEDKFAFAAIGITFFSDFSYVEEVPDQMEYELLPGERYRYETSFVCRYRGEYEVGIKEVTISDFLRLFRVRCEVKGTKKVIVAPKLIRIHELKSISDVSATMQRERLGQAVEQDIVTREYVNGDALKQIHWKATARSQKLMSRRMTGEEKEGVLLFFDTHRYDEEPEKYLPLENRLLETVLSLVLFLCEKNIPVNISCSRDSFMAHQINGVGEFGDFYELIKELEFDHAADTISRIRHVLGKGTAFDKQVVFFILQKPDLEILDMTKQISENGVIVVLYVVTEDRIDDFCAMSNANRRIIAVTPQDKLEEIL